MTYLGSLRFAVLILLALVLALSHASTTPQMFPKGIKGLVDVHSYVARVHIERATLLGNHRVCYEVSTTTEYKGKAANPGKFMALVGAMVDGDYLIAGDQLAQPDEGCQGASWVRSDIGTVFYPIVHEDLLEGGKPWVIMKGLDLYGVKEAVSADLCRVQKGSEEFRVCNLYGDVLPWGYVERELLRAKAASGDRN